MDQEKIGQCIAQLRKEKGLTQRQLAEQLGVGNKAVSNWERGRGIPDAALWEELAALLGADIRKLLQGAVTPNRRESGRMDRLDFCRCPLCGSLHTGTGKAALSCCGRVLEPLSSTPEDRDHRVTAEEMDGECYLSLPHEMTKTHHLVFAAWVSDDRVWFQRFYPEQSLNFRMPRLRGQGTLYLCSSRDGLFRQPFPGKTARAVQR